MNLIKKLESLNKNQTLKNTSFQIAMFRKDPEHLSNAAKLIDDVGREISKKHGIDLVNQQIMSMTGDTRVAASSKDGSVNLIATESKINFILKGTHRKEFHNLANTVLDALRYLEFKRIGYVIESFCPDDYTRLFKLPRKWRKNLNSFSMRLGHQLFVENADIKLNLIIDICSVENGIKIQTDTNTLEDQDISLLRYSPVEITALLANVTFSGKEQYKAKGSL